MEPMAVVAAAVAAGADGRSDAGRTETFAALKDWLGDHYPGVDTRVVEREPRSAEGQLALAEELLRAGGADDGELLARARRVLQLSAESVVGVRLSRTSVEGGIDIDSVRSIGHGVVAEDTVADSLRISGIQAGAQHTSEPLPGVAQSVASAQVLPITVILSNVVAGGDIEIDGAPAPAGLAELVERLAPDGGLPTIDDLDPYQLGATPSRYGEVGSHGVADPYVPRTAGDVERRVAEALTGERLVVVTGPSKAGKSRTLFEAVRAGLPGARVLVPTVDALHRVPSCVQVRECDAAIVVWLDDLDRFLTTRHPLTPALLTRITDRGGPTVVVATLRSEARDRLRDDIGDLTRDIRVLLQQATTIELRSTADEQVEHDSAVAAYRSLDLERYRDRGYGLAEVLAGAPELLDRYDNAEPVVRSIIEVAVDWTRIGRRDLIPEPVLVDLAFRAVRDRRPDLELDPDAIAAAIASARRPVEDAGRVAALGTEWLTDDVRGYRAFDYLVAADDGHHDRRPRPIADYFWSEATRDADTDALVAVGFAAHLRHRSDLAIAITRRAAETADPMAALNLGSFLAQEGSNAEAETWLRRAARAGYQEAMTYLGVVLHMRGENTEAAQWWRLLAEAGNTAGMANLGIILQQNGQSAEAEMWMRRAADAGYEGGMYSLGTLLYYQGRTDEAEIWLQRAAAAGFPPARIHVGLTLYRAGATADAERMFGEGAEASDPEAMFWLANLLFLRDELTEADRWWQRAAEAGNRDAAVQLAWSLDRQGSVVEAEQWWLRAAEAGDARAMATLAAALHKRGDDAEAAVWARRAAAGDIPNRVFKSVYGREDGSTIESFGVMLAEPRDSADAEDSVRRDAEAGDPNAMNDFAAALHDRGEHAEAEAWWRRAADTGQPNAAINLGVQLYTRGELAEAEAWWRRAAEAGNLDAMSRLGHVLREQGAEPEATQWWRRAATQGHANAMHRLGAMFYERHDLTEAETWWRRAAEADDRPSMAGLAAILLDRGETDEALTWFRRSADSTGPATAYALGSTLLRNGAKDEAETWLRRAAEAGNHDAMGELGVILYEQGATTEAMKWFQLAIDTNPQAADADVLIFQAGDTSITWVREHEPEQSSARRDDSGPRRWWRRKRRRTQG